ncbi:amidohydrolase family protein [Bradyrhizobium cytisi]|uniref:Amidohydrolase n=1 Tax=Bradyrhizobium cytisi TaxID=515489 RepID=A0A5S4VVH3_9BRAD|nr:amidohydrolase family protein [Bradyrhizobium cytisi]TYL71895.1 amidohydrolase [Bradyrhizobium cytisi]
MSSNSPSGKASDKRDAGIVDCDLHPSYGSFSEIDEFLPQRWREHHATIGVRLSRGLSKAGNYPRMSRGGVRMDAWLPDGGFPGSDLDFMRKQHLDPLNVRYGMLLPLLVEFFSERNIEFGAALANAMNEWLLAKWCDREPRLKAAIQIHIEHEKAAIAEIERRAGDRRFVQVQIRLRGIEPLGRRRYWPVLEACAANGLPVVVHISGTSGHPSTGGGWPSYYFEEHPAYVHATQALTTSLVCEGVFEQIPNLKVVLVEGGFAWLPSLCWRLDKAWKRLRSEVPFLRRSPSEYVRQNIWITTQPAEEPERPADLLSTMEWIGPNRIMFSTDYPHWDQDDPRYAFKAAIPEDWKRMIFRENASALYGLDIR